MLLYLLCSVPSLTVSKMLFESYVPKCASLPIGVSVWSSATSQGLYVDNCLWLGYLSPTFSLLITFVIFSSCYFTPESRPVHFEIRRHYWGMFWPFHSIWLGHCRLPLHSSCKSITPLYTALLGKSDILRRISDRFIQLFWAGSYCIPTLPQDTCPSDRCCLGGLHKVYQFF